MNNQKLINDAKKLGWKVDSTDCNSNSSARIGFSVKTDGKSGLVFYTPSTRDFFGILTDGTQFHSSDKIYFEKSWFKTLLEFFRWKPSTRYYYKNPILCDLPKKSRNIRIATGAVYLFVTTLFAIIIAWLLLN